MFKTVKQNKAYQDVVEQIQEAIMEGTLKPGSQLPAERARRCACWNRKG